MKKIMTIVLILALTGCSDPHMSNDQAHVVAQKCLDINLMPEVRFYTGFTSKKISRVTCTQNGNEQTREIAQKCLDVNLIPEVRYSLSITDTISNVMCTQGGTETKENTK